MDLNINDHIITIIGWLTSIGFFGWIVRDRKKQQSERKGAEATAMESMQQVYDRFTQHMKREVESLYGEIDSLKTQIKVLKDKLFDEELKYNELNKKYNELNKKATRNQ